MSRDGRESARGYNRSVTTTYRNLIGERWVPARSGATFTSVNPANHEDVVGEFAASGPEDVDEAVKAAAAAFPAWSLMPAPKRGEILFKVARLLAEHKEELARLMTREMGKVLPEARGDVQEAIAVVEVRVDAQGRVEGPRGGERPAADERALEVERKAVEQRAHADEALLVATRERRRHHEHAGAAHVRPVAEDRIDVGTSRDPRALEGEPIGMGDVVGVVEGDPLAARGRDAHVPRGPEASVGGPDDAQPARQAREHSGRLVGGAVVHDDHLVARRELSQEALDRLRQVPGPVVGRDDDGHGRARRRGGS